MNHTGKKYVAIKASDASAVAIREARLIFVMLRDLDFRDISVPEVVNLMNLLVVVTDIFFGSINRRRFAGTE